ncbi:hypothetical protein A3I46_03445 [Candidatus Kaiserbacteria bacterium RIFCSPLOWO2_02_FULL_54_13]|uniref:Uncharacterized protein n=1 Tax=Candidatus Kaiserbacteria bacterium RIFCSPHIGHO2_02_FULL_54_22 TaxID=1798495 RepID=A0A1F6DMH5_9BACT|nr:MAG: hypothetical protein A3C19_03110 [Candidatus Kaiserbacteria bacterium RIFCSPHIGHO2_02_FULL_54_22]OGG68274.1 MAG: hypothetical protein A3E99_00925 [Candidatus Kaiserbacteria bacterium RIFCSPHIGHO2_12_FULL_54_16]OGG83471.1 MAG: hypothetical protein A3I46_03445 [Candidatus Kaiserbacteria bacterium RIFCSPLOWO2_02_FULL_54_13]OGG89844.1 MAG: hypothetical protein A3G12_02665 [Candidatus Kaiserbacteria bacterium RIFCSPLOWO2_12_FULL_54_10]
MLTIGAWGINPTFLDFLEQLNNKKEGEPLINWQESLDFLIVFIGDGDCRRYSLGGWFCPFVDTIVKMYPKEGEDPFAGFEMSGGIQGFLRHHYKLLLGDQYEEFKIRHNRERYEYHASELLERWLKECPATKPEQVERIKKALERQNPSIHIPL